ncbi:ankyrin repeat protein [Teladorsagia circumcincta]|uniref:Ankyrin repeat protein n=1 Tax=Teladorsagia circumcincta TaxID=45464 RepID=A0A2G9TUE5_TELCI|nr:ankyrin repeat protein [Teladorsagia circumcincta]
MTAFRNGSLLTGAEVDARSHDDATPLHCAAIGGHQLVVKHLLKSKADVNACVVATLVEMGANVEAKDSSLRTPLHLASGSISDNGAFTVEYLVQNKAEVNVADKLGYTPLHTAASKGLDQVVEILVDAGADVDKPDMRGRNALHLAVLTHSEITVKIYLYFLQKRTDKAAKKRLEESFALRKLYFKGISIQRLYFLVSKVLNFV